VDPRLRRLGPLCANNGSRAETRLKGVVAKVRLSVGCLHTIFGGPDDCEKLCTSCRLDLCHHRGAATGPCRERLAGYRRYDNHYPLVGELDCLSCCRRACLAWVWRIASLSLSVAIKDVRLTPGTDMISF